MLEDRRLFENIRMIDSALNKCKHENVRRGLRLARAGPADEAARAEVRREDPIIRPQAPTPNSRHRAASDSSVRRRTWQGIPIYLDKNNPWLEDEPLDRSHGAAPVFSTPQYATEGHHRGTAGEPHVESSRHARGNHDDVSPHSDPRVRQQTIAKRTPEDNRDQQSHRVAPNTGQPLASHPANVQSSRSNNFSRPLLTRSEASDNVNRPTIATGSNFDGQDDIVEEATMSEDPPEQSQSKPRAKVTWNLPEEMEYEEPAQDYGRDQGRLSDIQRDLRDQHRRIASQRVVPDGFGGAPGLYRGRVPRNQGRSRRNRGGPGGNPGGTGGQTPGESRRTKAARSCKKWLQTCFWTPLKKIGDWLGYLCHCLWNTRQE